MDLFAAISRSLVLQFTLLWVIALLSSVTWSSVHRSFWHSLKKKNSLPQVLILNCPQTDTGDDHPIFRKELEAAVQSSKKKKKSAGVDSIPAELVQADGEDVITALTTICDKISNPVDPVLSHHTCQERQPAAVPELPSSVTQAKSCRRSYWTAWSHKRRRSSLQNRLAPEHEGAPQSRSSAYEFSVRNISSTSKTSIMSS